MSHGVNYKSALSWRTAGWSLAVLLFVAPLSATQVSDKMAWDRADFAMLAAMLLGSGIALEVLVRTVTARRGRAIGVIVVAVAFLTIFADAAVGIF